MLTSQLDYSRTNDANYDLSKVNKALTKAACSSKSNFIMGECLKSPVVKKVLPVRVSSECWTGLDFKGKKKVPWEPSLDFVETQVAVYETSLELFRVDESTGSLTDLNRQSLSRRILCADVFPLSETAVFGESELALKFPDVICILTEDLRVCFVVYVGLSSSSADFESLKQALGLSLSQKDCRKGIFITLGEFVLAQRPDLEGFDATEIKADRHGRGILLKSYRRLALFPVNSAIRTWSDLMAGPPVILAVHDFLWCFDVMHLVPQTKFIVRLIALYTRANKLVLSAFDYNILSGDNQWKHSFSWAFEAGEAIPLHLVALPAVKNQFLVITVRDIKNVQLNMEISGTIKGANIFSAELPGTTGGSSGGVVTAFAFPKLVPRSADVLQTMFFTTEAGQLFRMNLMQNNVQCIPLGQRGTAQSLSVLSSSAEPEWYLLALYGEGCDGEVLLVDCHTRGDQPLVSRGFRLKNWAPSTCLTLQLSESSETRAPKARDALFLCANTGKSGSVKRIEQGLGVSVVSTTAAGEMDGVTGLYGFSLLNEVYLAMVVNRETRFLAYDSVDMSMTDVSEHLRHSMRLSTEKSSLLVQSVGDDLCQVTPQCFIFVSEARTESFHLDSERFIIAAEVFRRSILALLSPTRCLVVFKVEGGTISQSNVAVIAGAGEPTCLFISEDNDWCAVGTRTGDDSGEIHLFRLKEGLKGEVKASLQCSLALNGSLDHIPHSLGLVSGSLLCGLRNGLLLYWDLELESLSLSNNVCVSLGVQPVQLSRLLACKRALARCSQIWIISEGRFTLEIEPVLVTDVICITPFPDLEIASDRTLLAAVDSHYLKLLALEKAPRYNLKSLNLHNTPRKAVFDPVSGKLIVAVAYLREESSLNLSRPLRQTDLKIIDPQSGKVFAKESLKLDELVTSMCIWDIKKGKRYLCIGTNGHLDRTNPPRDERTVHGRVLVFHLKTVAGQDTGNAGSVTDNGQDDAQRKSQYKLRQLGELHLAAPVTALCAYHHSYVLAGAGEQLCLLKIDAAKRELVTGTFLYLRSCITSISTLPGHSPPNSKDAMQLLLRKQTVSGTSSNSSLGSGSAGDSNSSVNIRRQSVAKALQMTNHRFQSIAVGTESDGVAVVKYDFEAKALRLVGMEPFGRPTSCAGLFQWSKLQSEPLDDDERKEWEEAQLVLTADRVGAVRLVHPKPANMTNDRGRFLNLQLLADGFLPEPLMSVVSGQLRALLFRPHIISSASRWLPSSWAETLTERQKFDKYAALDNYSSDSSNIDLNVFYASGILGSLVKFYPIKDDRALEQLRVLEYVVILHWRRIEAVLVQTTSPDDFKLRHSDLRITWPPQSDTFAPTLREGQFDEWNPLDSACNRFASSYVPWYLESKPIISLSLLQQLFQPPLCFSLDSIISDWLCLYVKSVPDALEYLARISVLKAARYPVTESDWSLVRTHLLYAIDLFIELG